MNNLQILKAQIEAEITKAEEFAKILWRSEESDSKVENAMGQLGGLRTALQLIRNQIAQAELDAYHPTIVTTEEPAPEETTPELVEEVAIEEELQTSDAEHVIAQIEKSIAETKHNLAHTEALYQQLKEALGTPAEESKPTTELVIEPLLSPVERALNGLMAQVKELPKYKEESFTMLSNRPHTIMVEFKGIQNPHWLELGIRENVEGEITYHLEKRLTSSDIYSGLFQTDEELLAFKYIRKEVGANSWRLDSATNSYRKLLPELKQVCFYGELDASGLEYYANRIAELNESGKPADEINAFMAKFDDYKAHAEQEEE